MATAVPEDDADLALRAVRVAAKRRHLDRHAEHALLDATEDLTLCCTASWERMRQAGTTAEKLFADLQKARFLVHELTDEVEILGEYVTQRTPRRRHRYSPRLRFRILEHMRTFMLTAEDTARRFHVTPQTIYNWRAELRQNPGAETIGSCVRPAPPVRRFSDAVRRLCRQVELFGFGGKKKIAEILLRHSWKVSPRSVGRFLHEKPTVPEPTSPPEKPRPTTVRGDYPNHLWLIDITLVPLLFPFFYAHVTVILDAFSRMPLARHVSLFPPSADTIVSLMRQAIQTHGRPRHLVSDHGKQFVADVFKIFIRQQGIRQRYGAVGESHSIGLIDRFFRTLKASLKLRAFRPWNLSELRRRVDLALTHYAYVRPHASLEASVPVEVYYGIRGHLPRPVPPARGRPGEPGPEIPFDFVFLDPSHRCLPVLVPKAA